MLKIAVAAFVVFAAAAQTQIDLRSQAKRVDFAGASSTKPMKTGTDLPAQCETGEVFFKLGAPAGANFYGCTVTNSWSVQGGISTQNCWYDTADETLKCHDSSGNVYAAVKTTSGATPNEWVDYIGPSGVAHTSKPTPAAVGATADPGANGVPYRSAFGTATPANADQLSRIFSCQDAAGDVNAYACNLSPAITAYAPGSSYWFRAASANTGAATVNFNYLGAKPILKQSNQPLVAGDIRNGQWVFVTYDGTAMQMQSQTGNPASGAVATVFGRAGAVTPQSGDYTTAQVTESGNLYFTNARAQQAFSYPGAVRFSGGALDCPTCITTATSADTDLAGSFPHLSVTKLQGRPVATTQPSDGQYLGWNTGAGRWEPKSVAAPPVASAFGRTGAITAQTGDYAFSQISGTAVASQLPSTVLRSDKDNVIAAGTRQDFSGAAHTLPMKSGPIAALPTICQAGEAYFATDAAPGNNIYGCTAGAWSRQGAAVTVKSDETVVGTSATMNYLTGPGVLSVISDTGSEVNLLWALDTAVVQTQWGEQSGAALYCVSTGGSGTSYECSLNPAAAEYTAGMTVHWQPDLDGVGGATTLDVDSLGVAPVKSFDGVTDPKPGEIIAGRIYDIRYDGSRFRLAPTTAQAVGAMADPGENGIVYRKGTGDAQPATATEMSGPSSCQDTGTTEAYACNLNPPITAYAEGTIYWFRANTANTSGAATINLNALGPKAIKKRVNEALAADDIVSGEWVMLTYDGTNMQMAGQASAGDLGYTAENAANKGQANGYAGLDDSGKVPLAQLPSLGGSGAATSYELVFDGATTGLADGSSVTWTCGTGESAQCATNWTVPSGVNWVRVQMWGGGGGGGGSWGANKSGVGGSGGGYAEMVCASAQETSVTIAVGLGGPGGTTPANVSDSTVGGDSSFGTCVTVTGGRRGQYSSASGWGGMVFGAPISGWAGSGGYSNGYCNAGGDSAGASAGRVDQGGCGASNRSSSAAGAGKAGGKGISGGGGGAAGAYNSDVTGMGGTSALGGAGGAGGAWTAATGLTECVAGTVPGGGGGGAGAETNAVNHNGCDGGRGEVRVYYTR